MLAVKVPTYLIKTFVLNKASSLSHKLVFVFATEWKKDDFLSTEGYDVEKRKYYFRYCDEFLSVTDVRTDVGFGYMTVSGGWTYDTVECSGEDEADFLAKNLTREQILELINMGDQKVLNILGRSL